MRYGVRFLIGSLLVLPFNWSMGEDDIASMTKYQIESYHDIKVRANQAIIEFEFKSAQKSAEAQAEEAKALLAPLLNKRERATLGIHKGPADPKLGFGKALENNGSRLQFTVQVPYKRSAQLSSRVSSVFEAMQIRKPSAVNVAYDVTPRIKANLEMRAAQLAEVKADALAARIGKRLNSVPLKDRVISQAGFEMVDADNIASALKQPFFITFRKNVVVLCSYIKKIPVASLLRKVV